VHALILGETGSGKSETMKLLMYQHIIKKEGFMLIDPHGILARDIDNILKNELKDYDNKVIYINTEDTNIKINPIEINDYKRYNLVVLSFINALKNLYEYAWGDRLETILRNALLLVIEADPPATLSKIAKVLSNKKYRDMLVKGSGNYDISNYWYHIYPNYAMEAFTAVYNKLDKLLSIASIKQIFDCEESTIDISKLIEDNKIIIIDLSSAIADDIIKFLGSLFIHMLYVNAKQNIALNKKYYLYIDEAQLISTFAVREVLNALRKFNVNVTIATQSINAFDKSIQKELTALCRLIILFRADIDTAKTFAYLFNINEEKIYTLPLHYFYFYQQGEQAVRGLAKSYVIS
jgi:DNA helicase HerA-like ATPase